MAWSEEKDMTKMLQLTKEENIKARCKAMVDEDGVVTRTCKECGNVYGYPTKNAWAQRHFGPDDGICPNCKGVYNADVITRY